MVAIAVIGIAGRFPKANNLAELLVLLETGTDAVGQISETRLKNTNLSLEGEYVTGGFLEDIDKFDYNFFNYAYTEAVTMDPHIRLAIENTYHCFEDAGYDPAFFKGSNTVVIASKPYLEYHKHAEEFEPSLVTGNDPAFLTSAINRRFGLTGTSMIVDTSCSSGLAAVQVACDTIILGRSDYAVVISNGLNLFPEKNSNPGLGLNSESGKSYSFSSKADGMSFGEAAVTILLKSFEKAVADEDKIYAIIKAVGSNNDAHLSASITAPDSVSQSELYRNTWNLASIDPRNIGFIEAHGSGTQLGDSIEIAALDMAFQSFTDESKFCSLSTIKNNIGHARNASGLPSLVKAFLSLKTRQLFPHINFEKPSEFIDFDHSAMRVQTHLEPWRVGPNEKRIAAVTSLGLSGSNFHIVIEEAPERKESQPKHPSLFIIAISAKSDTVLQTKVRDLMNLDFNLFSLNDFVFTLLSGREHFTYRKVGLAKDKSDLKKILSDEKFIHPNQYVVNPHVVLISIGNEPAITSTIAFFRNKYQSYERLYHSLILDSSYTASPRNNEVIAHYCFLMLLREAGIPTDTMVAIGVGEIVWKLANNGITVGDAFTQSDALPFNELTDLQNRVVKLLEREKSKGLPFFIDLGIESLISKTLASLKADSDDSFVLPLSSFGNDPFLEVLMNWYAIGQDLNWNFVARQLGGKKISLPLYPYDRTRCWIDSTMVTPQENQKLKAHKLINKINDFVVNAVQEVLCISSISPSDNFFSIGGNSLKATEVILFLNQKLNISLSFEDIFDYPVLSDLSIFVNGKLNTIERLKFLWSEVFRRDDISASSNFFNLGGHSLLANGLINKISRELKVKINFEDIYNHQTTSELANFIDSNFASLQKGDKDPIPKAPLQQYYPLSSSQYRLWILSQLDTRSSVAYNEPMIFSVSGSFKVEFFRNSLLELIRKHEILRTVFIETDSENGVVQLILNIEDAQIEIESISSKVEISESVINNFIYRNFDLNKGPLLRVMIIEKDSTDWIIIIAMHHIITDGWSMNVFIRDLFDFYDAFLSEQVVSSTLSLQYKDYAYWQQNLLKSGALDQSKKFWLDQMQGEIPVLKLAEDYKRPTIKTYSGKAFYKRIDSTLYREFLNFYQQEGCTLFMGLLAAVNTLLYRYTGQEDIIIGSPIANRLHPDLEDQIGFYINTLVLRTKINTHDSFRVFLNKVRLITLQAYEHQLYPFDELVNDLDLQRDLSRSPLFDVMVVLHNTQHPDLNIVKIGDLQIRENDQWKQKTSKFDLLFDFIELNQELLLRIEYNSDIFSEASAVRLADHFEQLLLGIAEMPDGRLCEIGYLSADERRQLLEDFNDTEAAYQSSQTLIDLFEHQAAERAEQVAVVFGQTHFSYRFINEASNQLGHYLRLRYGIKKDDLVGISLQRSEWLIIAVLGVLKSGAAYVPIDPDYPASRIEYITENSGCKLILDQTQLDLFKESAGQYPLSNPEKINQPSDLAYVIYTSGSTGSPKGVMIEHTSVINYLTWAADYYIPKTRSNVFGFFTSLAFDLTVTSLFLPLLTGNSLIVFEADSNLLDLFQHYLDPAIGINIFKITPSHISLIPETVFLNSALEKIIVGGEELRIDHLQRIQGKKRKIEVYNEYGPTEATVGCIACSVSLSDKQTVIGKPISNTSIYILDDYMQLRPVGITGEICIGGIGLARGYLNNPQLTQEKFVANPLRPGERLYRTGDLGRWLADGNVEYLGRKDDQVKIRGYRIELGEIEGAIRTVEPAIDEAAVLLRPEQGEAQLVAFITSTQIIDVLGLRQLLSSYLPSPMIPNHFIQVKEISLTKNGKRDKQKLLDQLIEEATIYISPKDKKEQMVISVIEEILKKKVSVRDNFFSLGGDSIKAIQIISKLRNKQLSLSTKDILQSSSIEQLVTKVKDLEKQIDQGEVRGFIPFTPIQQTFFEQDGLEYCYYNQSVLLSGKNNIDEHILNEVLSYIYNHHDALRIFFQNHKTGWIQLNKKFESRRIVHSVSEDDPALLNLYLDEFQSAFRLTNEPLFKGLLIREGDKHNRLLLVAHHLIVDGISWRILIEDINRLYDQQLRGEAMLLPAKSDSFKKWAESLIDFSFNQTLLDETEYWQQITNQDFDVLKKDFDRIENSYEDLSSYSFSLDQATTWLLINKCYSSYHTGINDILVSALCVSLSECFGMNKILIEIEGHGRENPGSDIDVTRTVGWFTSFYPLFINGTSNLNMIDWLIAVKESLHQVPNNGIGYSVLKYLSKTDFCNQPQIRFNYLGDFGSSDPTDNKNEMFSLCSGYRGKEISDDIVRQSLLDVTGIMVDGLVSLTIHFNKHHYKPETVQAVSVKFEEVLQRLITTLANSNEHHVTPVDLTYKGLSMSQLEELNTRML